MGRRRVLAGMIGSVAAAQARELFAGELEPAVPESVGLSAAGVASLDAAMRRLVDSGRRAGVVYGVARRGRVVALAAHGRRSLDPALPMTTDTLFRLYSQSRAVTAAAILTLVDEGRLRLDDPVAKYLPGFGALRVMREVRGGRIVETEPLRTPMTVRHLFNYTSGLGYARDWPAGVGIDQRDILDLGGTLADMVTKLARYPLLAQPGAKWIYGFHSDVLGRIAEVVSGQPFDAFLDERLLSRLGMRDTGFWVPRGSPDRLAEVYGPDAAGRLARRAATPSSTYTRPGTFFSAGGGLVSSVPDYLRFGQLLLNGGTLDGTRILKPATVREMGRNALTEAQGGEVNWYQLQPGALFRGYGWGLGIGVRLPGRVHTVPGSDGDLAWGGLASTSYFIDPREQLVAVAMSQYMGPEGDEIGFVLREGVYGALGG